VKRAIRPVSDFSADYEGDAFFLPTPPKFPDCGARTVHFFVAPTHRAPPPLK